ncbi:uncharacterized protein A1O9_00036 [Exophiala aquamarina CBS 119918]|uniref:Major facilitator superfamily (MFS) profile domain-containing protein n=1 Tax=Exophiala aquamarina CBS 119918 TaxID=1182545 RepID=A0A072PPL7_9EURO|nr:uncharacterized protein A1O9_00036 [Exophiala aquamarina CBS 119918]KEF62064.1 hypothetical protein A1O9_00036 [Exophiala aquamarina CBS 119918]
MEKAFLSGQSNSEAKPQEVADSTWAEEAPGNGSQSFNETVPDDTKLEKRVKWKQDVRIIPFGAAIFLLAYFDRANIGNAKTLNANTKNDMATETGMTNYQFTIALMVFYAGYGAFEVPSNYFLKKLRPSRWIAILMFLWGATSSCLAAVNNYPQVTGVRFVLGAAEAGLFPGLVYYLTFWYKTSERSIRVALIYASAILSGAFGGALAYAIGHMQGVRKISAWRWLFILEGLPSVVLSAAVWYWLPDFPETVSWLTPEEKKLAVARLTTDGSKAHESNFTWKSAKSTLMELRLWAHYVVYFGPCVAFVALSLFTPSIVLNLGYKGLDSQLMTVPPYAVGYCLTLLVSWSADRYNARALHSACCALLSASGYGASAALPANAYKSRYGCLIIAASGTFACIPPLLGWLSSNLFTTGSAGLAIALNITFSVPGQILGVWIYTAKEAPKGYPTGHWTNFGMMLTCAAGCFGLRWYYIRQNAKLLREAPAGESVRIFAY